MKQKFTIAICNHSDENFIISQIGWVQAQAEPDLKDKMVITHFNDLLERRAYEKGLKDAGYQGLISKYRTNGPEPADNK